MSDFGRSGGVLESEGVRNLCQVAGVSEGKW